jgi:ABC-type glycerol-3-phosphate transport system permease component
MTGSSRALSRTGPSRDTWTQRLLRRGPADELGVSARAGVYVVLIAASVAVALPFLFVVSASFKDSATLFTYPPQWFPDRLYTGNYARLLFDSGFPRWMANTLFVASTVTLVKVLIDSMAGYALAKMRFRGRNALFILFLACLMIPSGALLITLYKVVNGLGLTNTYFALILPALANPLGIFVMRQYIMGLPRDLENAARLDGVSEFGIFWRIVLPLVRPGLVVLAVIRFSEQYMSFIWPLVAIRSMDLQVFTVGLTSMRTIASVNYGLYSAGAVMALVPIAILFFLLQKQFLARSIAGALKQ